MTLRQAILSLGLIGAGLAAPAMAQEAGFQLPAQCAPAQSGGDHGSMDHMGHHDMAPSDGAAMPDHARENMRRMMATMPAMEAGMQQQDPDVAFACAMIAHHQGAIDMAEVLLQHGDDPQMIALAKEIVTAQVAEIDRMKDWLAQNAD